MLKTFSSAITPIKFSKIRIFLKYQRYPVFLYSGSNSVPIWNGIRCAYIWVATVSPQYNSTYPAAELTISQIFQSQCRRVSLSGRQIHQRRLQRTLPVRVRPLPRNCQRGRDSGNQLSGRQCGRTRLRLRPKRLRRPHPVQTGHRNATLGHL